MLDAVHLEQSASCLCLAIDEPVFGLNTVAKGICPISRRKHSRRLSVIAIAPLHVFKI